jgi:hypothetical protein
MTPLDDALEEISAARDRLLVAVDILEKRRDPARDAETLREMVCDLAGIVSVWSRERDRWR